MTEEKKLLIKNGSAIKSFGDGRFGGLLVRYSDENNPDLEGDYFTKNTDYGFGENETLHTPIWFHHRQPLKYKDVTVLERSKIGDGILSKTDDGIFLEAVLYNAERYASMIDALGLSSGTAEHLVDREAKSNGTHEIQTWILGTDASITPTPAEPKNKVITLKAFLGDNPRETESETVADSTEEIKSTNKEVETIVKEKKTMENESEKEEIQEKRVVSLSPDELKSMLEEAVANGVKAYRETEEPDNDTGAVLVTKDAGDRDFRNIGEQLNAIKAFEVSRGRTVDARLKSLKSALGGNELVPSEGGFLLAPNIAREVLTPIHEAGVFLQDVSPLPVGSDSSGGWINGVDETSLADGSRWGGVQAYWIAEAEAMTQSKPKFRRINWELNEIAALVYETDQLSKDALMFSAIVNQSVRDVLDFKVNAAIFEGDGAGKPDGVMSSGALITVAKESGQAANTVVYKNLIKMWSRLAVASRAKAKWYINSEVEQQLNEAYMTGTASDFPPRFITYGLDGVMNMFGRPVAVNEHNNALGDKGDILLGDMSQYLFWDKGGVETAESIHVQFLTNQKVWRFVYRVDGKTVMASPVANAKGSGTKSAFVTLAARA